MNITIIRTSGQEELHTAPRRQAMQAILDLIGASVSDTVNLRDGRVMIVDDAGYETITVRDDAGIVLKPARARKPVNKKATDLYHGVCRPGTTHKIVGDVAIVVDADFDES